MHRAVLLATGPEIEEAPSACPTASRSRRGPAAAPAQAAGHRRDRRRALVGQTVAEVEQQLILDTLRHCLGNRTHAANILGISIRTLRNKLKEYTARRCMVPPPSPAERRGA